MGEEKREAWEGAADWSEGAGMLCEELLGSAEEEEGPAGSGGSDGGSVFMVLFDSSGSLGNTGNTSKGMPSLLTLILIS